MTINSIGYLVRAGRGGGAWYSRATNSITGVGRQPHSEITTINALGRIHAAGPFLIEQDGFPCAVCDATLMGSHLSVIFKITANNGRYSGDHQLPLNYNTFPYYIWYLAGVKTHGTAAIAPAGFPAIPSVAAV